MDARLEKIENSEAYLEIEVDGATVDEGLEKAFRKVVKQVNIPGFRKGKVPREFLEAHFGKEILFEDALEFLVPDAYEQALDDLKIEPIAQPDFDIGTIQAGQPLQIKVKVPVKPEVVLGQLEGLEVSIPLIEVTETDVARQLEEMRSRYARLVDKTDEPSEIGDTITIDFVGTIDGIPFPGGTSEDYPLELGSNTFIPGFEEQLLGLKVGESKDVLVAFPAAYHAEDLAGKDAVFQTTVKKIEHRELRELDDELAQEISDFDTIEELRNDIRANLVKANEIRQNGVKKKEVLAKAVELCNIDIAPAVAEMQFQTILSQFEQRMASQGIELDQYFQYTNSNLSEFKNDMYPEAIRTAKTNFMLEKIIADKGFDLTDEEVDKQVEDIAEQMGVEIDQARQNLEGVMDQVRFNMKLDKAIQYLVDNALITAQETPAQNPGPVTELED
jgi:trigger factor